VFQRPIPRPWIDGTPPASRIAASARVRPDSAKRLVDAMAPICSISTGTSFALMPKAEPTHASGRQKMSMRVHHPYQLRWHKMNDMPIGWMRDHIDPTE